MFWIFNFLCAHFAELSYAMQMFTALFIFLLIKLEFFFQIYINYKIYIELNNVQFRFSYQMVNLLFWDAVNFNFYFH